MLFDTQQILDQAKQGDEKAKGELLNRFRPYLNVIAQRMLDDRLQGRMDSADVVQTFSETMLLRHTKNTLLPKSDLHVKKLCFALPLNQAVVR